MTGINSRIAFALFLTVVFNNTLNADTFEKSHTGKLELSINIADNPITEDSHNTSSDDKTNSKKMAEKELDLSLIANFLTPVRPSVNKRSVNQLSYEYVGGRTRVGVGIDTEFDGTAEIRHFFKDTENRTLSTEGWLGFDLSGKDKGFNAGGIKLNNHWVKYNNKKKPLVIKKTFVAYDRNTKGDNKLTLGYGQEIKKRFWEVSVGKGLSGKRNIGIASNGQALFEKAYDFNIGGQYGVFRPRSNTRWRGGLDYSWDNAEGAGEDDHNQLALSLNVEKFFHKKPHSVSLGISTAINKDGYNGSDNDTRANLTYRYEFNKKKKVFKKSNSSTWVKRALYNPIKHSRYVATYQTKAATINGAPIAVNDGTFILNQANPLTIDVLVNDSDPEGDPLTIISVTMPSNGSASIVNGQILYTPNQAVTGTVVFFYTISDSNGGTSTASITVQINSPSG